MSLTDKRITGYKDNIADLPDRVIDDAEALKKMFDGRGDKELKASINGMIDSLLAETAAGELGAVAPEGVIPKQAGEGGRVTLQAVLEGLKAYADSLAFEAGAGDMVSGLYDPKKIKGDAFGWMELCLDLAGYDVSGKAREAGGIIPTARYVNSAAAEVKNGVLEIASLFPRSTDFYTVQFDMPAGYAGGVVKIDGEEVTISEGPLNADSGTPTTIFRRGTKAFLPTGSKTKPSVLPIYSFKEEEDGWDELLVSGLPSGKYKKRYRKQVYVAALPNTTTVSYPHGVANMELGRFNPKGCFYIAPGITGVFPTADLRTLLVTVTATNFFLLSSGNASGSSAIISLFFNKTTDTTVTREQIESGVV